MSTTWQGSTPIKNDQYYDLTTLIPNISGVDVIISVIGTTAIQIIEGTATQPANTATGNVIAAGDAGYVNAANIWARALGPLGGATIVARTIS